MRAASCAREQLGGLPLGIAWDGGQEAAVNTGVTSAHVEHIVLAAGLQVGYWLIFKAWPQVSLHVQHTSFMCLMNAHQEAYLC